MAIDSWSVSSLAKLPNAEATDLDRDQCAVEGKAAVGRPQRAHWFRAANPRSLIQINEAAPIRQNYLDI